MLPLLKSAHGDIPWELRDGEYEGYYVSTGPPRRFQIRIVREGRTDRYEAEVHFDRKEDGTEQLAPSEKEALMRRLDGQILPLLNATAVEDTTN
ncbi:MAG: hypothetical protein HY077_12230 [Elusimicrobia bacterium]|nr:hypothetical protein [Elusimicrobiota bacterium]